MRWQRNQQGVGDHKLTLCSHRAIAKGKGGELSGSEEQKGTHEEVAFAHIKGIRTIGDF